MKKGAMLRIIVVVLLVVVLDQLTKFWILERFSPGDVQEIIPGVFNLILTFNPGVAFGFLANLSDQVRNIVLGITTFIALSVVGLLLFRDYRSDPIGQAALAMILGGAVGNIIDRLRIGKVVDFLDFYYKEYHWPAFNVADSSICVGVTILVLKSLFDSAHKSNESEGACS